MIKEWIAKFLPFVVLLIGCNSEQSTKPINSLSQYTPGQVVVQTTPDISFDYFDSWVRSLHLSTLQRNHDIHYFLIEINPDSVTAGILELSRIDSLFTAVSSFDYLYSDANPTKKYLFAFYKYGKEASDTAEGKNVVVHLGMVVKRIGFQPHEPGVHALLSVPVGIEVRWVEKLQSYPFIKYAELNYFFYVDD